MLTEQEKTEQIRISMEAAFRDMTKEDMVDFLMAVSARTGVVFTPLKPKQTNLEYLMELYASGNLQRIARDRIKFKEGTDTLKSFYSDFGQLTYRQDENKDYVIERAVEFEIEWLKEYSA